MAFGESLKRVFARNKSMASLWPSPSTEAVWQSIPTPPHWWLTEGAVAQGGSRAVPDAIPVVAELEGSSAPLRRHDPMSASPTTTQHVLIEQDLRAREGWAGAQAVATDENRLEFLMQVLEASAREQSTALAAVQDATVAQLRDAGHAIEALRAESFELRERTEARHGELQGRVADLERQLAESRERVARTEPILALLTKQAILTASGGGLQSGIRGGSSSKKSLSDFTFGPDHATACTSLESCHKLLELVCRGETLLLCDSCGVPQAGQSDLCTIVAAARDDHIETFSDLPQQCCQRNTCKPCGAEKLLESLETKWWQDLSADDVVRVDCLAKNCSSVMSITSERKFFKLLRSLGVRNPDKHIQAYTQARVLRPHLLRAAPPITEHASGEARILHRQLEAAGFMATQLALIKALESDNSNNNSGELVTLVSTDRHGVNLQIPVFTGLLKRSSNGGSGSWSERTCCICASTFPGDSLAISSEAAWVRACGGFGGNWMWKIISSFPLSRHLGCSRHHEVNFCRGCLATHMNTKIEELGSARCHLLSCMMPECGRRLTYEEVKFFASTATFEKYDRYLLLNRISSDPNFRWCLREGCRNGQIVPDMAVHNLPEGYYSCDGCGFEMCSSHQTVWHTGMTCAEVSRHQTQEQASERQERDSSRQWIEQNTKTCPGCDVRIEKNAGCFHMTCSCGFEFCWECLADWRSIVRCTNGNATYISTGHNASCFFHGADLQPTQLAGRTLEEALQGRA